MGVSLRGRKRSVSQKFLHRPEIGSTLDQVGREGMAEGMGAERPRKADRKGPFPEDAPGPVAIQRAAALAQQEFGVLGPAPGREAGALPFQIGFDRLEAGGGDRDQALLAPLPPDPNEGEVGAQRVGRDAQSLGDTQPAGVEQMEQSPIPQGVASSLGAVLQELGQGPSAEDGGQVLVQPRSKEASRGVLGDALHCMQVAEKAPQHREGPSRNKKVSSSSRVRSSGASRAWSGLDTPFLSARNRWKRSSSRR